MDREFEREIIPMARSEGLALAPWAVLAGGKIRTDAEEERRRQTGEKGRMIFEPSWERNDHEKAVCNALEKVASEIGAKNITSGEYSSNIPSNICLVLKIAFSCYCLLAAQDAIRLPDYWRAQA